MKAAATFQAVLAALALAGAAVPAQALTLVSSSANGQALNASVVGGAAIRSDVGYRNAAEVSMQFEAEAADLVSGVVSFNAVISLLDGNQLPALQLTLDNAAFALVGSVAPAFGSLAAQSGTGRSQWLGFAPPESFGLNLGDPFGQPGAVDWQIDLGGLAAGDRFSLTISAVPEPGAAWLLALGLPMLGAVARRRRVAGRI